MLYDNVYLGGRCVSMCVLHISKRFCVIASDGGVAVGVRCCLFLVFRCVLLEPSSDKNELRHRNCKCRTVRCTF